ncbi:MAG: CaiB/BaiF CoA-transferase family protein [Pseudomonadota bacterium]
MAMAGPLHGIRVIEMAGMGPGPFCGMLLADMGADVVRVERLAASDRGIDFPPRFDLLNRNKRSVAINLKSEEGRNSLLRLIGNADALMEGFRPGVMEKLGLGPDDCLRINPKLVYGRITGWGQNGPLAPAAGHDVNYIALAGALHGIGPAQGKPAVPLNLIGDFGGGALFLAMGMLAAIIEARSSGKGQVVDTAMVDGVASLMTMQYALLQMGMWKNPRGENLLDGGAPFYDVYETSDGLHVSVGAVERRFYEELLERLGLKDETLPKQNDQNGWKRLRERLAGVFAKRTRDEWCTLLEGSDACFAPVLSPHEAVTHPHSVARGVYTEVDGVIQPQPAPRFSRTPSSLRNAPPVPGSNTAQTLVDWGFTGDEVARLQALGEVAA